MSQPTPAPVAPEPMPTTRVLWHLAMECLLSPDMLDAADYYLRCIGSPPALRLIDRMDTDRIDAVPDLAWIELQAALWFRAGLMNHGLLTDAACADLAAQHELAADLDAATIQRMLSELPAADRLA